jgi:uncharacterized protein (TIGR03118 family)
MVERLEDRSLPSGFVQTALISDIPGFAPNTNPNFLNPWSFIETSAGPFRVALNGAGRAMLIDTQGAKTGADIMIPPPAGSPKHTVSAPTGEVVNTSSGFVIAFKGRSAPASLIFDSEDGTIAAWNPALSQTRAVIAADQSGNNAVYKGLAMGSAGGAVFLYATNFHNGTVDVFDANFHLHTFMAGQFTDTSAPAGFAPFGIRNIGGVLFVTFAKQNAEKHDDVAGPGNGFIDEFSTSGQFLKRLASGTAAGGTLTALNSPFGLAMAPAGGAMAPAGFGSFSGDLLVGNFGDSHVSAFDPATGKFLGQLTDPQGNPLVLNGGFKEAETKGLWSIDFGNGSPGAGASTLFFAAGINDESDGLFGEVNVDATGRSMAPGSPSSSSQSMQAAFADTVFRLNTVGAVPGLLGLGNISRSMVTPNLSESSTMPPMMTSASSAIAISGTFALSSAPSQQAMDEHFGLLGKSVDESSGPLPVSVDAVLDPSAMMLAARR